MTPPFHITHGYKNVSFVPVPLTNKKCEASQESLKINILACIALHKICIEKGNLINQNLDFTFDSVTNRKRLSGELRDMLNMVTGAYTVENSKGAESVRKALSDYFWEQKEVQ